MPACLTSYRAAMQVLSWLVVTVLSKQCAAQPQPEGGAMLSGLAVVSAIETASVAAIEKAERSVVAIAVISRQRNAVGPLDGIQFADPLSSSNPQDAADFFPSIYGSGVVISQDGYIVTCAHVLDDPLKHEYRVWLDRESYPARVVGMPAKVLAADPFSDLAVLKIEAEQLTPIEFAKREELRKGQFVIALGNPQAIARDGQASASWGIVSNLNRFAPPEDPSPTAAKESIQQLGTLIQTDAKLTLGTSGGALVNLRGQMVGLTTSLAATSGYEQAAGFAIAVDDMFIRVVEALKLGKLPEYGFLGIQPEDVRSFERELGISGAKVAFVIPGLPGEEADLRAEDIITQVNQLPIHNRNDLFRELSKASAGSVVNLQIQRFRPGSRTHDELNLKAELSKKYVSSSRPGYASNAALAWRGMDIDYSTAVPPELARSSALVGRRGAPKVAVLSVEPDTETWRAGIRPGFGIHAVHGKPVSTPEQFRKAVVEEEGDVAIRVMQSDGQTVELTVSGS